MREGGRERGVNGEGGRGGGGGLGAQRKKNKGKEVLRHVQNEWKEEGEREEK